MVGFAVGTKKKKNKGNRTAQRRRAKARAKERKRLGITSSSNGSSGKKNEQQRFLSSLSPGMRTLHIEYNLHFNALVQLEFSEELRAAKELIIKGRSKPENCIPQAYAQIMTGQAGGKSGKLEVRFSPTERGASFRDNDIIWICPVERAYAHIVSDTPVNSEADEHGFSKARFGLHGTVCGTSRDSLFVRFDLQQLGDRLDPAKLSGQRWRVDRGPNLVGAKRMSAAVESIFKKDFASAALRRIICRAGPSVTGRSLHYRFEDAVLPASRPEVKVGQVPAGAGGVTERDLRLPGGLNDLPLSGGQTRQLKTVLEQTPLNNSQRQAIARVLQQRLSLVQGPPGTGKTTTAVALIAAYTTLFPSARVLVSAFSNVGVDQILTGLRGKGVDCVRIGDPERVNQELLPLSLQSRVEYAFSRGPLSHLPPTSGNE